MDYGVGVLGLGVVGWRGGVGVGGWCLGVVGWSGGLEIGKLESWKLIPSTSPILLLFDSPTSIHPNPSKTIPSLQSPIPNSPVPNLPFLVPSP